MDFGSVSARSIAANPHIPVAYEPFPADPPAISYDQSSLWMPTGPAVRSPSAPPPAAPSPLVPDVFDPLAERCPCANAGDVTHASNAASSRQRVTTSQVVLSSVGLRSSNPSNPSWSSTAPARAPKRRASSSPLLAGTVMALILMTVIRPSWHRREPAAPGRE